MWIGRMGVTGTLVYPSTGTRALHYALLRNEAGGQTDEFQSCARVDQASSNTRVSATDGN